MGKRLSLVKGESLCFFYTGLSRFSGWLKPIFSGWLKPIFLGWQNLQKKAEKAESKTSEISRL